jgi:hypothetical protein
MKLTPQQKSTARRGIVESAQARIGIKEDGPPYNNRGPEVDAYLAFVGLDPGNPWCLAFAEYCVNLGLAAIGGFDASALLKTGYCPALADHARANGTLMSAEDVAAGRAIVRPGDLALVWETFADPAQNNYHHSGIVEIPPLSGRGDFHAIEGNTNTDGASEGYIVARQIRRLHSTAADGHARYAFVMTV